MIPRLLSCPWKSILAVGLLATVQGVALAETRLAPIRTDTNGKSQLAVNPVTNRVFVSGGALSVVDGSTQAQIASGLAAGAGAVALNPVTNRVYVRTDSAVIAVDGNTNAHTAIPVGGGAAGMAVNPATNEVYALHANAAMVTIIDGVTHSTTAVPMGSKPRLVAINPVTNKAYVISSDSNALTVIDGATKTTTAVAGTFPVDLAVNPVTNKVYVANPNANTVTVIDGTTNGMVATIPVGQSPQAIAVNPATNRVYVANSLSRTVSIIDGALNTVMTVPLNISIPTKIAINLATHRVYVAGAGIDVIDGATNVVRPVSSTPMLWDIAVNPLTNHVYASEYDEFAATTNVQVFDGANYGSVAFDHSLSRTTSLAANPVTGKIYALGEKIAVIDEATLAVTLLPEGLSQGVLAVNPATNKVYASDFFAHSVVVVDGQTNAQTRVTTSGQPTGIGIDSIRNKVYVANRSVGGQPGTGTVTVIDGETLNTTTITGGTWLAQVAVDELNNKVYVVDVLVNGVFVIDGASRGMNFVSVGSNAPRIAMNSRVGKVFVVGSSPDRVTVIDSATGAITATIALADSPGGIAVNRSTNRVYVTSTTNNTLVVIDGNTNAVTSVPAGPSPNGVAVDEVANKIYVTSLGGSIVTVVDGATNSTATVAVSASAPAMVVDPVTGKLFIGSGSGPGLTAITPAPSAPAKHGVDVVTPGRDVGSPTSLDFSYSVCCNYSPSDPPVLAVYHRSGDKTGAFSRTNSRTSFTAGGLRPGLNYVTVFAIDAMGGSSMHSGAHRSSFTGTPKTFAFVMPILQASARLTNLSTRAQVLTGDDRLIGGFIIGGSAPKTVMVRARGPSLTPLGVPNALANPMLQLFSGSNQIASNDDWGSASNSAQIQASGFAPPDAAESAILTTLAPGPYTALVSGTSGGTGIGIVELFEMDRPDVPLVNIATRGRVGPNDDVMIAGFIIEGGASQTVVVRARGPSLASFGVADPLADPMLRIFSGSTLIATNDNWADGPDAGAISASGFAPAAPTESVVKLTLPPGAYTAIVSNARGSTGVGIVEVFAQSR